MKYDKVMDVEEYVAYMNIHYPDMHGYFEPYMYYERIEVSTSYDENNEPYVIEQGKVLQYRGDICEVIKVVRGGAWHVRRIMG